MNRNPLEVIARRKRFEKQLENQRAVMAGQALPNQGFGVQELLDEIAGTIYSPAFLTIAIIVYFIIH